jgi:hypothetical protein
MGKLHSLKRAIYRDPELWYDSANIQTTIFGRIPCGAKRVGHEWLPIRSFGESYQNRYSYALYVRSVLEELGIRTDKPRSTKGVGRRRSRGVVYDPWE